jgi:hypothetical protein
MRGMILGLVIAFTPAGCCAHRLHFDDFRVLTLDEQMVAYYQAWRSDCVRENDGGLLSAIASHGYEAADAMATSLKGTGVPFPPADAIRVIEFVHFDGFDLRQHEAFRVLQELAQSAPDSSLRKEAGNAVVRIERRDPFFGRPPRFGPPHQRRSPAAVQ